MHARAASTPGEEILLGGWKEKSDTAATVKIKNDGGRRMGRALLLSLVSVNNHRRGRPTVPTGRVYISAPRRAEPRKHDRRSNRGSRDRERSEAVPSILESVGGSGTDIIYGRHVLF